MSVRSRNYKIIIQRDSNALTTRVIQLLDAGDTIYEARDTAVAAAASASASATQAEGIVTSAQDTIDQAVEAAQTAQEAAEAAMSAVVSPFVEGVIGTYTADHPSQNQIILRGSFAGKQAIDLNLGYGADQYPSGFTLANGSDADGEYTVISPASGDWPIGMAFYARGVFRSASDPAEAADRAEAAAQAAEAAAANSYYFQSRSLAEAGTIPATVQKISVLSSGIVLDYIRDASGTALTTAGGDKWSPSGADAHPEHFGAPTGTNQDSGPSFQAALDWTGADRARRLVDTFGGIRTFATGITLLDKHVRWFRQGTRYLITSNVRLLAARVTPRGVYDLTADYVKGSTDLAVSMPQPLVEGDFIRVLSNGVNPYARGDNSAASAYRVRETAYVTSGSTTTNIKLGSPLKFVEAVDITAGNALVDAFTVSRSAKVVVYNRDLVFEFSGGTISYTEGMGNSWNAECVRMSGYYRPVVSGVQFSICYGSVIANVGCLFARITACDFGRVNDDNANNQFGYVFNDGGYFSRMEECNTYRARNAYTSQNIKTPPTLDTLDSHYLDGNIVGFEVINCRAYNCTSTSFNTHHGSFGTFTDCYAEGGVSTAFVSRGHVTYVRPVGRMLNAAMGASTDFQSGNYIAGKERRFLPKVEFVSADIECVGVAINASLADVTFSGHSRIKTSSRQAVNIVGRLNLKGSIDLTVGSLGGATPLNGSTGDNVIRVDNASNPAAVAYIPNSDIIVSTTGSLFADTSELTNQGGGVLGGTGTTIIDGSVSLKVANGQQLFNTTSSKVIGRGFRTAVMSVEAPDDTTVLVNGRTGLGFDLIFPNSPDRQFTNDGSTLGLGGAPALGEPAWPNASVDNLAGVKHGGFYSVTTTMGAPIVGPMLYIKRAGGGNAAQIIFGTTIQYRTSATITDLSAPTWTAWATK